MPSTAHEEYLSEQGTWIGVHEKSRVKVSLLRQWWEVLSQGTVGDEARPLLHADHMPRAKKLASEPRAGPDSRRGSGACQSDASCAGLNEEQDQETDGATDPRI